MRNRLSDPISISCTRLSTGNVDKRTVSSAGRPNDLAGLTAFMPGEGSELRSDGGTGALLKQRVQAKVTAVVV